MNDDWKTPLGYYERAIAELNKTREEIRTDYANLTSELQVAYQEIQALKAELKATQLELENTNQRLDNLQKETKNLSKSVAEIVPNNESLEKLVNQTKNIAEYAYYEAKNAQNISNSAISETKSLKKAIENGTVIAQKALMLQSKDENNWLRFHKLDSFNHHCFKIWKLDDNTWHDDIKIKAALWLQTRDDKHWMRFYRVDGKNRDVFAMWRSDQTWHDNIQLK